jgi:hypothetical protein
MPPSSKWSKPRSKPYLRETKRVEVKPAVEKPPAFMLSASSAIPGAMPMSSSTARWWWGSRPESMVTWEGRVQGEGARACSQRSPSAASRSMKGEVGRS